MNRRELITGAAALALAAALPAVPALPSAVPDLSWVVGTPGEMDALFVRCASEAEALAEWHWTHSGLLQCEAIEHGQAPPPECECEYCCNAPEATRVKQFDKIAGEPTIADWMRAGFDVFCQKCGYEASRDCGGISDDGRALCEGCFDDWQRSRLVAGMEAPAA